MSDSNYSPLVENTDGWYRNMHNDGKLHCGWCLPANAALALQAQPHRKYLNTKSGDFFVLQDEQIEKLTPEEKLQHRYCGA
jgi:hypothetical protein